MANCAATCTAGAPIGLGQRCQVVDGIVPQSETQLALGGEPAISSGDVGRNAILDSVHDLAVFARLVHRLNSRGTPCRTRWPCDRSAALAARAGSDDHDRGRDEDRSRPTGDFFDVTVRCLSHATVSPRGRIENRTSIFSVRSRVAGTTYRAGSV